jgi:hypothetical protein
MCQGFVANGLGSTPGKLLSASLLLPTGSIQGALPYGLENERVKSPTVISVGGLPATYSMTRKRFEPKNLYWKYRIMEDQ